MPSDAQSHGCQSKAYERRGKSFELAVSIFVTAVFGFAAYMDKKQHYSIGQEVGQRMYRIGSHGGTATDNAGNKLEQRQHYIDGTANQSYLVYFSFAIHLCFITADKV